LPALRNITIQQPITTDLVDTSRYQRLRSSNGLYFTHGCDGTTPGMNWYYRGNKLPFKKILRAFEPGILPELYWQAVYRKIYRIKPLLLPDLV
jgi:hypothetical protein